MINWPQLLQEIESEDFAAFVNVASTRSVFIDALNNSDAFRRLLVFLHENPANASLALSRLKRLSQVQIDYRYVNPHDAALAAYVWALAKEGPDLARIGAELVASAERTWWAKDIASIVLNGLPSVASANESQVYSLVATADNTGWRIPSINLKNQLRWRGPVVNNQVMLSRLLANLLDVVLIQGLVNGTATVKSASTDIANATWDVSGQVPCYTLDSLYTAQVKPRPWR